MVASAFTVVLPTGGGRTYKSSVSAMVVWANTSTEAKLLAAAYNDGDSAWSDAVATALVAPDWTGYKLRVKIDGTAVDVTVTGGASATIDAIAALAVTALIAAGVAGAAYNSTTQVLTIAAATTDLLGDKYVRVELTPPGCAGPVGGLVSSIVNGGAASAALTCTFPADAYVPPVVLAVGRL